MYTSESIRAFSISDELVDTIILSKILLLIQLIKVLLIKGILLTVLRFLFLILSEPALAGIIAIFKPLKYSKFFKLLWLIEL